MSTTPTTNEILFKEAFFQNLLKIKYLAIDLDDANHLFKNFRIFLAEKEIPNSPSSFTEAMEMTRKFFLPGEPLDYLLDQLKNNYDCKQRSRDKLVNV
ncbi:hypothetical protein RM545_06440 [Zunongwangia sp. F260]|uniref:Uncharacterized protein n=1 Tax=Autumnicola lenta TaxID=3075593 RepID=A0ABU3CIY7_9FLAO|nr:hypothetical protein [Zunongwangia sp. F260]MDT0646323.1 hypothetical protein [Zunongwangia sp. F260]